MITLFGYNTSPYAAKVRAILRYKQLPFEEKLVDPADRRELVRLSGQQAVPVLVDGARVVHDSTRIARWLDEAYPERPVLPRDPALRARALLVEEWADEGLPGAVQPVRWLIRRNAERTIALFKRGYPMGLWAEARWAAVARVVAWDQRRKYGPRPPARVRETDLLNRLAEVCDLVDAALAESGWLAGPSPTVADFAAWGWLHFLEGLDGWETVKTRRRLVKWLKAIAESEERPETDDVEDAAQLEARRHRESQKRLPVV